MEEYIYIFLQKVFPKGNISYIPGNRYKEWYILYYVSSHNKVRYIDCISFHSCQILSPSETGFMVSAHRLPNTLLTLIATLL